MAGIGVILNPRSKQEPRAIRAPPSGSLARSAITASSARLKSTRRPLAHRRGFPAAADRRARDLRRRRHQLRHHHRLPRGVRRRAAPSPRLPARRHLQHRRQLGRRPARQPRRPAREPHPSLRRTASRRRSTGSSATSCSIGDHYGFIFGTGAIYGFIAEYDKTDPKDAIWAAEGARARRQRGPPRSADAGRAALGGQGHARRRRPSSPSATTSRSARAPSIKSALVLRLFIARRAARALPHPRHPHDRAGLREKPSRHLARRADGAEAHPRRRDRARCRRGADRRRRVHVRRRIASSTRGRWCSRPGRGCASWSSTSRASVRWPG